jgi:hypothetical protein
MVGHVARHQHGRTQMLKTTLVAAAAALIATGLGVWATSPTNARAPSTGQGIDPHQMMMNASAMPATEFVDYSFVFVHWVFRQLVICASRSGTDDKSRRLAGRCCA